MLEPDRIAASSRYESAARSPAGPDDEARDAFGSLAPFGVGLVILVFVFMFLPTSLAAPLIGAYGGYSLYGGLRAYQRRRVMLHAPTARIEAAPIGSAELSGTLGAASAVTAPFSGTPCIFWRVVIWERRQSGSKTRWRHVGQEEQLVESFWLEDETGRIAVVPRGVELVVGAGDLWRVDAANEGDQGISESGWAFLESRDYWQRDAGPAWDVGGLGTRRRLEIREARLEVGGAAYVLGTIARAGDLAFSPRDATGPVVYGHSDAYGDGFETPFGRISLVAWLTSRGRSGRLCGTGSARATRWGCASTERRSARRGPAERGRVTTPRGCSRRPCRPASGRTSAWSGVATAGTRSSSRVRTRPSWASTWWRACSTD